MADPARRQRGSVRTVLSGAAASVLVTGGLLLAVGSMGGAGGDAPAPSSTPSAAAMEARLPMPAASTRTSAGRRPEAVVVPALEVEAAVSAIQLENSALTPPDDPRQVGWWSQGARPGASAGSAVLTGHTVHTGGGAFDDLETLSVGDDVVVRTARGPLTYDVESVRVLGRGELARRSAGIFEQNGPPRLVLITCEDWDGTAYLSNVVVTATPTG